MKPIIFITLFLASAVSYAADISFRAVWAAADPSQVDEVEILWLKNAIPVGSAVLLPNTVTEHDQTITNVANGDNITYRITSRNAFGETSKNSEATAAVAGTPPPTPTGLQPPVQLP